MSNQVSISTKPIIDSGIAIKLIVAVAFKTVGLNFLARVKKFMPI